MCPQPLSKVRPNAHIGWSTNTLEGFPEFAGLIINTISAYSVAELILAEILATLLKSEARTVTALYLALSGAEARRAAIFGAASEALKNNEVDFGLFNDVMRRIAPARNRRNDFSHWIWGESADIPKALLLIDPTEFAAFNAAQVAAIMTGNLVKWDSLDRSKVMVYRKNDLEESVRMAREAATITSQLRHLLQMGGSANDPIRAQQLRTLLGPPGPVQRSRKSTRVVRPRSPQ